MTNRDLFRKIKKLEKIEPSEAWVNSTRSFVLDYARIREKSAKESLFFKSSFNLTEKTNYVFAAFRQKFALQAASAAVILLIAGNFIAAKAAESLPGDNFYAVKLLAEKAELALTFDEDKRIDLKFKLAEGRLDEFSMLVESGKVSPRGTDSESVNIAMDGFQNQLNSAVSEMDNAAKSGVNNSKAVAVAKKADDKTAGYAQKIEKATVSLNKKTDSQAKGKVIEAMNKIEEANINALTVLASANKKSGDSVESSNSKEIAQKVGEKIKNAEEKAKLIEEKVLSVKVPIKASVTGSDIPAETESSPATKLLEEAKGVLLEAKNDLAGNNPGKALEKIIASNAMATAAEKIADTAIADNVSKDSSGEASGIVSPSPAPADGAAPLPSQSPAPADSSATAIPSATPAPPIIPKLTPTATPKASASPNPSLTPNPTLAPTPNASASPSPTAAPLLQSATF